MKPCPCGHLGDPRRGCRCTEPLVERYRAKISGPLLDRIDLHVEVPAVSLSELRAAPAERSAAVAERVAQARARQHERLASDLTVPVNAAMGSEALRRHCPLEPEARRLLDTAFERLRLSARALTRVMKVARTIADLAGAPKIAAVHVAEAIQYRSMDRRAERF